MAGHWPLPILARSGRSSPHLTAKHRGVDQAADEVSNLEQVGVIEVGIARGVLDLGVAE